MLSLLLKIKNLNKHSGIPSQMTYHHSTLHNLIDMVNAFAKHFNTKFSNTLLNADHLLKFVDYSSNTTVNISSV